MPTNPDNGPMGRLLTWLVVAALAVAAYVYVFRPAVRDTGGSATSIPQHDPAPGDPPVVWIAGRLTAVGGSELVLREGDGPTVRLQRLAAGATKVFHRDGNEWEQGGAALRRGQRACIEALLDDASLVAIRVFVEASGCGPA